jgi:hypothetical protein
MRRERPRGNHVPKTGRYILSSNEDKARQMANITGRSILTAVPSNLGNTMHQCIKGQWKQSLVSSCSCISSCTQYMWAGLAQLHRLLFLGEQFSSHISIPASICLPPDGTSLRRWRGEQATIFCLRDMIPHCTATLPRFHFAMARVKGQDKLCVPHSFYYKKSVSRGMRTAEKTGPSRGDASPRYSRHIAVFLFPGPGPGLGPLELTPC